VATNLKWIGEKARKEPELVFTSLYHHIVDVDNLRACYDSLEADKATGVDGVSKLLRHNGQFGKVQLLRLSRDTDLIQVAQPQEPTPGAHLGRL
jgi:hypothetical protein